MRGLGALVIMVGIAFVYLTYTKSTGQVLAAIFGSTPATPAATAVTTTVVNAAGTSGPPPTGH